MTITAGMTSSSFDVDIINNTIQDGDKMFTITIRLMSICLSIIINSDTTTVTVIDDDGTAVSLYMHAVMYFCYFSTESSICFNYF